MNSRLQTALSLVLTVCAVVIAAAVVDRHFFQPAQRMPTIEVTSVRRWNEVVDSGILIGSPDAAVKIVEFGDFECPFCKRFHQSAEALIAEMPGRVSLVYLHFPLSMHRFARPAARAAECARAEGLFDEIASELFAKQDSIGLKTWTSYASAAGVQDTLRLKDCMNSDAVHDRIEALMRLGRQLNVTATPTVMINGWRFSRPPRPDSLRHFAQQILAGNSPFPQ